MSKKRNANVELLRLLSMLMVTMLHALGKGELLVSLTGETPVNGWIAWALEALSIGAVNIFMLISGYFLVQSEYKWKRVAELVCQVLFYTVGAFLVFFLAGWTTGEEKDVYHLLHYLLPIHMDVYWFITTYLVIYLALPVLAAGVKNVPQKQLKAVILGLMVYECFFKSLLPVALETDSKGYSVLWYFITFLLGAYFRLYGFHFLNTVGRGFGAYALGSALIFLEEFLLDSFNAQTGRLSEILRINTNYNHLFVVLASVGIFSAFLHMAPRGERMGKVICAISPYALGIYLLQENVTLRYRWQKSFGLVGALQDPTGSFLGKLFAAVIVMAVAGLLVDALRALLFRVVFRK